MTSPENYLYDWFGLNKSLFFMINKIHAPVLDQIMLTITWLGHPGLYPFYIAVALLWAWRWPKTMRLRNVVVFALGYLVSSVVVIPALKSFFDFPRPLAVLGAQAVTVLGVPDSIHSFPSGHAAYAVLMAVSLMPGLPQGGKYALLAYAVLVCISRISVGAHFPADVLAGAGVSLLIVWIIGRVLPD